MTFELSVFYKMELKYATRNLIMILQAIRQVGEIEGGWSADRLTTTRSSGTHLI